MTEADGRAVDVNGVEDSLRQLADEQAGLRRVATLVAKGAEAAEIFGAVAVESARILDLEQATVFSFERDGWVRLLGMSAPQEGLCVGETYPPHPGVVAEVWRTGLPATVQYERVPGDTAARLLAAGMRSALGVPITVEGSTWGVVNALSTEGHPLPDDAEPRLAAFTELAATAIANADARAHLEQLADEQAALRRIAVMVAEGVPPEEVFAGVAAQVGNLLNVPAISMVRFEPDGTSTAIALWGDGNPFGVGATFEPWPGVMLQVRETGRPARLEDFAYSTGPTTARLQAARIHSGVGVPIVVDGHVWGTTIALATGGASLPDGVEERLTSFTRLVATAIANTEARDELRLLLNEQRALRQVATLVAKGAGPDEVFGRIAAEIARVLGVTNVGIYRYEPNEGATIVAAWGGHPQPIGHRHSLRGLRGHSVLAAILESGRAARIDDYSDLEGEMAEVARELGLRWTAGVPIVIDGRLWGVMAAASSEPDPTPDRTEARLSAFTELAATAISNTQFGDDLRRLAEEQVALRRVATLVAEGAPPEEVFAAVAHEVAEVSGLPLVELARFDPDGWLTVVGAAGEHPLRPGTRWPMDNPTGSEAIRESREPRRIEYTDDLPGIVAQTIRSVGVRWAVGVPIVVDGQVWGSIGAAAVGEDPPPPAVEARLTAFTEIVATAISNATANSQLLASRARIVAAGDEARRRIERDLHDGTQQQLVSLGLDLQALKRSLPPRQHSLQAEIQRIQERLNAVTEDIREISRGLHPPLLTQSGLDQALRSLARRSGVPVELDLQIDRRLPQSIEIAAYFVVSEALANASKHADASVVRVTATIDDSSLVLEASDDGRGGARPETGSGLAGLIDRVEALGGRLTLASPRGRGTTISVELPLGAVASDV